MSFVFNIWEWIEYRNSFEWIARTLQFWMPKKCHDCVWPSDLFWGCYKSSVAATFSASIIKDLFLTRMFSKLLCSIFCSWADLSLPIEKIHMQFLLCFLQTLFSWPQKDSWYLKRKISPPETTKHKLSENASCVL